MTLLSTSSLFRVSILHSSQNTMESLLVGSECILKHCTRENSLLATYVHADGVAADEHERVLQELQAGQAREVVLDGLEGLQKLRDLRRHLALQALHVLLDARERVQLLLERLHALLQLLLLFREPRRLLQRLLQLLAFLTEQELLV